MKETFPSISDMSIIKRTLLYKQLVGYIWMTLLGGMFVGFGIILLVTIGGLLDHTRVMWIRVLQGMTFGVALTIVVRICSQATFSNDSRLART